MSAVEPHVVPSKRMAGGPCATLRELVAEHLRRADLTDARKAADQLLNVIRPALERDLKVEEDERLAAECARLTRENEAQRVAIDAYVCAVTPVIDAYAALLTAQDTGGDITEPVQALDTAIVDAGELLALDRCEDAQAREAAA